MSPTSTRRLVTALVLGVVCTAGVAIVHADYRRAYYEGYRLAHQGGNWELVAQKMAEAIKEYDREGENIVLTSANAQPYLPYFYLGLARFQLGDCRGARENWIKSSVQKKVVLHGREREWFNKYSPICELVVPIEDSLKQVQGRLQSIGELADEARDRSLAPAAAKLRQEYDEARKSFEHARATRIDSQQPLLLGVKASATQLSEHTEALFKSARDKRDEAIAQRLAQAKLEEKKTAVAPEAVNAANTTAKPADPVVPPPMAPLTPIPPAPIAVMTPPEALRAVALHYSSGRYRDARSALQAQAVPNEWRAHAALLRAASAFALFHAEGQRDRALLDEARRAVLQCTQAKANLRPSRRLYPPPFIEFFERTVSPPQTARARD